MNQTTILEYDCSDLTPDTESINHLNHYLQVNCLGDINFKFEQFGHQHEPIFWTTVDFEGCEFYARGRTKKDCEKKIRTYIWRLISEHILVLEKPSTPEKAGIVRDGATFTSFVEFPRVISKWASKESPVIIIDLENLGEKVLNDQKFKKICNNFNFVVICICCRVIPENNGNLIVLRRDDQHKESTDEGVRRIIYYMIDHLGYSSIGLITRGYYGQTIKDALEETNEKFFLFRDIEDFNAKYVRLIQTGANQMLFFKGNHLGVKKEEHA